MTTKKTKTKAKKKTTDTGPADVKLARIVGTNVARLRARHDMTQETLGKALKVTPLYVSAVENGRRLPSLPLLIRISRALGTTLDALVTGDK